MLSCSLFPAPFWKQQSLDMLSGKWNEDHAASALSFESHLKLLQEIHGGDEKW